MSFHNAKIYTVFCFLVIQAFACSRIQAPERQIPRINTPLTVIEKPEVAYWETTARFVVKTNPGNTCKAFAIFDVEGKRGLEQSELPELIADQNGLCTWDWYVPKYAKAGEAALRVRIMQMGEMDLYAVPEIFCIEKCP